MKSRIAICVLLLFSVILYGQNRKSYDRLKEKAEKKFEKFEDRKFGKYDRFKAKAYYRFERFRAKANERYAEFMAKAWSKYDPLPPMERPIEPKPVIPPVYIPEGDELDLDIPDYEIPFEEIDLGQGSLTAPDPMIVPDDEPDVPQPPAPKPEPVRPEDVPVSPETDEAIYFDYYGSTCSVPAASEFRFSLQDISEPVLSAAWMEVSDGRFNGMLSGCLTARRDMNLCDWAYMKYVEKVTDTYLMDDNAKVFLQHYILTQSGYKTRLARPEYGTELKLLVAFDEIAYDFVYIQLGNDKFYVIDKDGSCDSYYVYDAPFENEYSMSLEASRPVIRDVPTDYRILTSEMYPSANASVRTNSNLIEFYNDYPVNSNWNLYANASLSEEARSTLYPSLRKAIAGKSDYEAVEILLNFVQTSLEYMTDDEQFGYERPLFPDESLYYPYCDCEDRSILFSVLVRELVGLDVVLLYYPGHLATAVCFNSDVSGDYLTVGGRKYVVCDPTYINANVGMTMPQYKGVKAEVVRL